MSPPRGRLRLQQIELLLLAVVVLIGYGAYRAFLIVRAIDLIPVTFSAAPAEYARIADHTEPAVEELNELLHRFASHRSAGDWEQFQSKARDLKDWIDQNKSSVTKTKITMVQPISVSADPGTLLSDIDKLLAAYLAAAQTARDASGSTALGNLEKANECGRQLHTLAAEARAHGQTIQMFLIGSKGWFPWFRRMMFASLLLLLGLGAWLSIVIYQRVVSPLQLKLLESDTIIERQQKLVHFGELAAVVAHEIRNPLTAIRARLFTLQKSLMAGTTEYEDSLIIRNEILRLDRIVKDFLQSARPSSPSLIVVSAGAVLREVCDLLAPEYEKQSIQLILDSTVDAQFLSDPAQLKQVLINLVQNAAESIEHDGTITLRTRCDTNRLKGQMTDVVILEIEDTGPGIPTEVQDRLFDPFFSTKRGGTGLGLSIASQIMEKHRGAVQFQSQIGHGTTFQVLLPVLNGATVLTGAK